MDQNDINRLRGKTAVVGLAESGCGLASGWSAMETVSYTHLTLPTTPYV